MLSNLLLLSGNDIPFQEAQLIVHQPTIKEIAYIGEEAFFSGCELLNFSKENALSSEDKIRLEKQSNFEIFMSIMRDKKTEALRKSRLSAYMVLSLLFPNYQISFDKDNISLKKENDENNIFYINNKNYEKFKSILIAIFCLKKNKKNAQDYNPGGDRARAIAEKLSKGRAKAAAAKGEDIKKISVMSRYISILSVGSYKNISDLMQLTVYQLFDEFERFELKQSYDVYFQYRLAGAKDIEDVDHWMKELHP